MFFRREKPHVPTFSERLDQAKGAGFSVSSGAQGATRVSRDGIAADVREGSGGQPEVVRSGAVTGDEILALVELGYQSGWQNAAGKRYPATAVQLKAFHNFTEDLRAAFGLTSLYNEGLGTVNRLHLYDRLTDRDVKREKKPWEVAFR